MNTAAPDPSAEVFAELQEFALRIDGLSRLHSRELQHIVMRLKSTLSAPAAAVGGDRDALLVMTDVLKTAWAKAEPKHDVTLYPASFEWTFREMARAALSATPAAPVGDQRSEVEWLTIVRERDALIGELTAEAHFAGNANGLRLLIARAAAFISATPKKYPGAPVGGFVVVPSQIHVDADAWESASFAFGGPATGEGEAYMDCTLWIGEQERDDGSKVFGMHVSCNECPEEGSITLAEFAASPAAQSSAKDGARVDGDPEMEPFAIDDLRATAGKGDRP